MSPVAAVAQVFGRYAAFTGRARRAEYWWFTVFICVVQVLVVVVGRVLERETGVGAGAVFDGAVIVVAVGLALPSLAVTWRRLHDAGIPGPWMLVGLVPLLGGLVVFLMTVLPGTTGPNRYGADPKARADRQPVASR